MLIKLQYYICIYKLYLHPVNKKFSNVQKIDAFLSLLFTPSIQSCLPTPNLVPVPIVKTPVTIPQTRVVQKSWPLSQQCMDIGEWSLQTKTLQTG
jgi:hypothetical protein